jgi:hypothetical protein
MTPGTGHVMNREAGGVNHTMGADRWRTRELLRLRQRCSSHSAWSASRGPPSHPRDRSRATDRPPLVRSHASKPACGGRRAKAGVRDSNRRLADQYRVCKTFTYKEASGCRNRDTPMCRLESERSTGGPSVIDLLRRTSRGNLPVGINERDPPSPHKFAAGRVAPGLALAESEMVDRDQPEAHRHACQSTDSRNSSRLSGPTHPSFSAMPLRPTGGRWAILCDS